PCGLIQGADGVLYGDGACIFRINTDGSGYTNLHTFNLNSDGVNPLGVLFQGSDGALYGTTSLGGTNGGGVVFKINTDGNGYQVLHSFGAGKDGNAPRAALIQANN